MNTIGIVCIVIMVALAIVPIIIMIVEKRNKKENKCKSCVFGERCHLAKCKNDSTRPYYQAKRDSYGNRGYRD